MLGNVSFRRLGIFGIRVGLIRTTMLGFEIQLRFLCIGVVGVGDFVCFGMGSIGGTGGVLVIRRGMGGIIIRGDRLRSFRRGLVTRTIGIIAGSVLIGVI